MGLISEGGLEGLEKKVTAETVYIWMIMTHKVTIAAQFGHRDIGEVYRRHRWEHLWWLARPWMVVGVTMVIFKFQLHISWDPNVPLTILERVAIIGH